MTGRRDSLERIAAALERLAPDSRASHDWTNAPAYIWGADGARPIDALDALPLGYLTGVDRQKEALHSNTARLAAGAAAHDTLLWGARGMGKSALVRSVVADIQQDGGSNLALVQVVPGELDTVPALMADLAQVDRSFLLFIDDLGFGSDQQSETLALRSLLDGGIVPRPPRLRVAVTSNRRAIVARDASEADAIHERDARDDALALADRFGLTLAFHPCDRETYLEIIRAYTDPLDLSVDEEEAMAWAIARGNRSGRTALQFATELAGRAGVSL